MSSECLWGNCDQEPVGDSVLCYFHDKRAENLIAGYIPGPGLTQYTEPTAKVRALIEALYEKEEQG